MAAESTPPDRCRRPPEVVGRAAVMAGWLEQTALLTQMELARIALDNPDLMRVDGTTSDHASLGLARRQTLLNLWVSKWRSLYGLGGLSEPELRRIFGRFFRHNGEAGDWRVIARDSYRVGVQNRPQRRFVRSSMTSTTPRWS